MISYRGKVVGEGCRIRHTVITKTPVFNTKETEIVADRWDVSIMFDMESGVAAAHKELTAPGGELVIAACGEEILRVNAQPGGTWDCNWGPRVSLTTQLEEDGNAVLTWSLRTTVPREAP